MINLKTWFEEILKEKQRFDASPHSFEATMQDFERKLSKYSGFDRMVIHAYRPYYALWFSEDGKREPIEHGDNWQEPQFVNLNKDTRTLYEK